MDQGLSNADLGDERCLSRSARQIKALSDANESHSPMLQMSSNVSDNYLTQFFNLLCN
jgi:hypothetical protein